MDWDKYFISMLYLVAMKSKDEKTQNSAIIDSQDNRIKATGYNSFPSGINDYIPERQERPEKYFWMEHGERNAIYNAARDGVKLKDCRLYVTGIPCMDCARAIVQVGIIEVVYHTLMPYDSKLWHEYMDRTVQLFKESGIVFREYTGDIISKIVVKRDGKEIEIN